MTSAGDLVHTLLGTIEAADLDAPDEDFVSVSLALLALAISRLPPSEREAALRAIEDGGALRQAVEQFPAARSPFPKVNGHANGNGNAVQ